MDESGGKKQYNNAASSKSNKIPVTSEACSANVQQANSCPTSSLLQANEPQMNIKVIIKHLVFDSVSFQRMMHKVHLMRQLDHENVVTFHSIVHYPSESADDNWNHIYVVQELLDTELMTVIRSGQLMSSHCKLFTYQLMRGLKYIHSADICHGNLQPSSIHINCSNFMLKIGDFTLDCKINPPDGMGSFWYQSPELIISGKDCTKATDLWSAGCIVAEMATGQPLFRGNSRLEQLLKIIDSFHLNDDDWQKVLHVMPNKMLKNHPFRPRSPLQFLLKGLEHNIVQLLDHLLVFNHQHRVTAEEALSQPYLLEYHCPDNEPVAHLPLHTVEDREEVDASLQLLLSTISSSSSLSGNDLPASSGSVTQELRLLLTKGHALPLQVTHLPLEELFSQMKVETDNVYKLETFHPSKISRNDVALKNLRNNQERIGGDRTPSPNIIDLLNQSFESDPGGCLLSGVKGPSGKMHEADSESEKDTAEISDEKLQEDLEVGNLTIEVLQRLGNEIVPSLLPQVDAVQRPDALPMRSVWEREDISIPASSHSFLVTPKEVQKEVQVDLPSDSPNETDPYARNFIGHSDLHNLGCSKDGENEKLFLSPKHHLHHPLVLVNIPEDSNKRNCNDFDEKQTLKSRSESVHLSRKLILDKIESEKNSRQEMSRIRGDLTSEEFDELYRLPTEHLRKEKDRFRNERLRQPSAMRPLMHSQEWPRCGRHPDDPSERYSIYKDDRLHVEGACGGHDYYDDMHGSLPRSSIQFDLEPYLPELAIERSQTLSLDELDISAELQVVQPGQRGIASGNRDASSSPESPASPRTIQTGARPKKSPKKHRAV